MSEKRTYKLVSDQVRAHCIDEIARAPLGKVVIVQDPTRTLEANARLHAMLTDISRQAKYMGKPRSVEFWKGLFVSGWAIATGQRPEIVPGLEGEFIAIRESTATMSGKRLASVMEYIEAYCAMNEIRLSAPEDAWA